MSDPHAPRRVSATIKFPETDRYKGDNPWLVFEGSVGSVREQIIEAFGLGEEAQGMTLHELVSEAEDIVVAISTAKAGLGGGKVVSRGGSAWGKKKKDESSSSESQSTEPEQTKEDADKARVLAEIAQASSSDELKQLWARNQEVFKDPAVMQAAKDRGNAIKSAA